MRAALTADRTLWRAFAGLALGMALAFATLSANAAPLPSIELEVELDPDTRAFSAQARIRQQTTDFSFALHEALEISAASADGKPVQVIAAGREGSLRGWRLVLPMPGVIEVRYGGTLPALDSALDHRAVLQRLAPMAAPEGSFLPAGSAWYPQPGPLFTYRVAVSVPGTQRALVAGRLQSETLPAEAGAPYRASFEFTRPTDGIDLMAGPWQIREQLVTRGNGSPLRLRTYFPAELDAIDGLATAYLDDSRRYIERYSEAIGPYPYTAFSVVASPLPTGFGMPTLTYIGAEVLKLPFIRASSLGHEVLHNWWGNGVFVDYASGNWAEGLTTFMADYAYKEDESATAARDMRLGWLRDFAAVPEADQRPLAAFRSRTHGAAAAVGYGKSAMLFVMLRDQIGAEAFDRGIRGFWQQNRFGVAGWEDLRAAFEAASGRDLSAFFAQWLERSGGPTVRIEQARAHTQGATTRLIVDLTQSEPPYALTVPVELVYAERSETRALDVHQQGAQLTLDLTASPDSVRLDPDLRLWRVLAPDQLPPILRQWVTARAPRLVVAGTAVVAGTVQVGTATATAPGTLDAAAHSLAARFFERPPHQIDFAALAENDDPVLLIGLHEAVDAALASAGLPPRPESLGLRGSAQVWTVMGTGGAPVAVVSARDAAAVEALLRPLPHYGAQSWLVFDGSRALERGIWAAPGAGVTVTRD